MGSQISVLYGVRMPGVFSVGSPSGTNWVAMPQVKPADFDVPDYSFRSPNSSNAEVEVFLTTPVLAHIFLSITAQKSMLTKFGFPFPFDNELMLEHHQIPLPRLEAARLL